jgi:regulator of nonsense transcripts 2
VLDQDRRNHEAYIKSGEIFEDRQHAYEKMTKVVEKLTTGVQGLADLLGLPSPALPTAANLAKGGLQIVDSASSFQVRDDGPVPGGIWDDEEEKRFYEELVDLKEHVPSGLLGIKSPKAKTEGETPGGEATANGAAEEAEAAEDKDKIQTENLHKELEAMLLAESDPTSEAATSMSKTASANAGAGLQSPLGSPIKISGDLEDEQPSVVSTMNGDEDAINSGPAARLSALFAALPEASNREMVDKLAIEFAFLNSKAARRRLVKVCLFSHG